MQDLSYAPFPLDTPLEDNSVNVLFEGTAAEDIVGPDGESCRVKMFEIVSILHEQLVALKTGAPAGHVLIINAIDTKKITFDSADPATLVTLPGMPADVVALAEPMLYIYTAGGVIMPFYHRRLGI